MNIHLPIGDVQNGYQLLTEAFAGSAAVRQMKSEHAHSADNSELSANIAGT